MERNEVVARIQEILEGGGGEELGAERFLPLVTLDSGARCGLDREARWVLVSEDGRPPARYSLEAAYLFHEALEWKRDRFDDAVEEAANAHGLPGLEVVYTFPVLEVIRAVLAKQIGYLTRLALQWIRPSELRELRREIKEVADTPSMPVAVKDLATRLIVPE